MATLFLQQRGVLKSLAFTRGQLVKTLLDMPREGGLRLAELSPSLRAARLFYAGTPSDATVDQNESKTTRVSLQEVIPSLWPSQGRVQFIDLCLRYAPNLPDVLRNVSLEILPGEVVVIVGRTGAGKSSLVAALTRLVEPSGGRILVDGVDITSVPLQTSRLGLTVVTPPDHNLSCHARDCNGRRMHF